MTHGVTFWHSNWLCLPVKLNGCLTSSFYRQNEVDIQCPSGRLTYCRSYVSAELWLPLQWRFKSSGFDATRMSLHKLADMSVERSAVSFNSRKVHDVRRHIGNHPPNTTTSHPSGSESQQYRCDKLKVRIIAGRPYAYVCMQSLLVWNVWIYLHWITSDVRQIGRRVKFTTTIYVSGE